MRLYRLHHTVVWGISATPSYNLRWETDHLQILSRKYSMLACCWWCMDPITNPSWNLDSDSTGSRIARSKGQIAGTALPRELLRISHDYMSEMQQAYTHQRHHRARQDTRGETPAASLAARMLQPELYPPQAKEPSFPVPILFRSVLDHGGRSKERQIDATRRSQTPLSINRRMRQCLV